MPPVRASPQWTKGGVRPLAMSIGTCTTLGSTPTARAMSCTAPMMLVTSAPATL